MNTTKSNTERLEMSLHFKIYQFNSLPTLMICLNPTEFNTELLNLKFLRLDVIIKISLVAVASTIHIICPLEPQLEL